MQLVTKLFGTALSELSLFNAHIYYDFPSYHSSFSAKPWSYPNKRYTAHVSPKSVTPVLQYTFYSS